MKIRMIKKKVHPISIAHLQKSKGDEIWGIKSQEAAQGVSIAYN
jgi:hypothetical protein